MLPSHPLLTHVVERKTVIWSIAPSRLVRQDATAHYIVKVVTDPSSRQFEREALSRSQNKRESLMPYR